MASAQRPPDPIPVALDPRQGRGTNTARGHIRRLVISAFTAAAVALGATTVLAQSAAQTTGTPDQVGEWGPILNWPTQGKHMLLMPTNKVLMFPVGDQAYLWNIATNEFKHVPATFGDLHCAGHVSLADGSPFIVGGVEGSPFIGIKVAARFDPATETWDNRTPMTYARWYPTITTLGNGDVLAAGGTDETKAKTRIAEVYNPDTNTWRQLTGASNSQPLYPFHYQLSSGKVYFAAPKSSTEYLDVAGTGAWSSGPTSGWDNQAGGCCNESGAMYEKDKIIRSGGGNPAHARTGVIDMGAASPQWREVESMAFPRRRHNMVVLADGSVLAVGGTRASDDPLQAVLEAERWDPATEQWDTMAAMSVPRMYHSAAILLPDGRVVAAGGDNPSALAKLTAQIYKPAYLFKGPRPVITSSPPTASYGSQFTVNTDTAGIVSVALIRPGSATHAIDMNQRYLTLPFTQSGNDLTVTAPATGNIAPPGAYMLVVKNANGVPSVASWIVIGSDDAPPPPPPPGPPTANFTASPTSGTPPLEVQFSDTSTGAPTEWAWDFENDGTVDSTVQYPRFTYETAGTYTVKLVTKNGSGSDDEIKTGYINVTATAPAAGGTTVTLAPEADARVQEANPATNYGRSYLRADGGSDPGVESYLRFNVAAGFSRVSSAKLRVYATTVTYNGPAVYSASDNGWLETAITWSNRPAREATGTADTAKIPANTWIEFDVTPLVAGDGTYTFVLATDSIDGLHMNSREATDPNLRPQLVVTGDETQAPPTANFSASLTSGTAPLTVRFTDLSTGATNWSWDFQNDDGFESTERHPTYTYTTPGTYSVRLFVENAFGGDQKVVTDYITVNAAPPPGGTTVTLAPEADARVEEASPTTNYGKSYLRADGGSDPDAESYLRFNVAAGLSRVSSAKLRVYATSMTSNGPAVYTASDNGWLETGITWLNRPVREATGTADKAGIAANTWIEFDVTPLVAGAGTYTFVLATDSTDGLQMKSREATDPNLRPHLLVTGE